MVTWRSFIRVAAAAWRASSSRGIERGLPVPTATGEILSDWSAETVHASMSTDAVDALDSW
jgi:hypothetical protein